jgi:hypothetical protein
MLVLPASAAAAGFDDIELWVGRGVNESALVIDWNDGLAEESLVWGYRWDGAATGEEMLEAVVRADDRLFGLVSPPFSGFGRAVNGLGYDADGDGFGTSPAVGFDGDGYAVGSPLGSDAADADDHWEDSFQFVGYWAYWLGGTSASPAWSFASVGVSGRSLVDGSWDGLSFGASGSETSPSAPVAAVVPEPATAGLFVVGLAVASVRRRGRA